MSLTKYHNLLMFQISANTMHVIGEDASIIDFETNATEVGMTVAEQQEYNNLLASITTIRIVFLNLNTLPPGTSFTGLKILELNNCSHITNIPASYPNTLEVLKVASTKLSSIPTVYSQLQLLDVSNCKRISSVSINSLQTIIMSHSSVTELATLDNLVRLVALNSKITQIPSAPNLVVVMWSGVSNSELQIHSTNTSLIHILTSGPESQISSANGLVTSILL